MTRKKEPISIKPEAIKATDVDPRNLLERSALLLGVLGAGAMVTACTDGIDVADPVTADRDVARSDADPFDPVRGGDPARVDGDYGD